MIRGPQILALTCPIRTHQPLLLRVRDPCVSASSEAPSPRWGGPRARRGSSTFQGDGGTREREERASLLSAFSSPRSDCGCSPLNTSPQDSSTPKAAPSSCRHQPQDSRLNSVNHTPEWSGACLAFDPWEATILERLEQNCGAVHSADGSDDIKSLQRRRPVDSSRPPAPPRPIFISIKPIPPSPFQGRPFRPHPSLGPPLVSSIPQPRALDLQRAPLSGARTLGRALSLPQTRGVHQAARRREAALRECLSAENRERCCRKLAPNLGLYDDGGGERAGKGAQGRWASVLVSLCSVEGEPAFLFTLRSSTLKGRHKGDVSFPGGKRDPVDRDVVDTALREAREELGVTVATDSVWGVLKPLHDMSGMTIAPVLANLGPLEALSFRANPGEVEEIFTLSLSHICSPENTGYTHFRTGSRYGYTLPVFRNGKHRVWGLTAVALDHTLKLILPSQPSPL